MEQPYKDLWGIVDNDRGRLCVINPVVLVLLSRLTPTRSFLNTISEECDSKPPPEMYGGIVADPMGLGKTLSILSLIATDVVGSMDEVHTTPSTANATLVIVPPPRMVQMPALGLRIPKC